MKYLILLLLLAGCTVAEKNTKTLKQDINKSIIEGFEIKDTTQVYLL